MSEAREYIVGAAVRYKGDVFKLPRPNRHGDIMRSMRAAGQPREAVNIVNQGFLTSTGRFVGREEAYGIAKSAGQLLDEKRPGVKVLFTEDLW